MRSEWKAVAAGVLVFLFSVGSGGASTMVVAQVRDDGLVQATLDAESRLILLPEGTRSVELTAVTARGDADGDRGAPSPASGLAPASGVASTHGVRVGPVMIQRGRPLLPVVVDPERFGAANAGERVLLDVTLIARDAHGDPITGHAGASSRPERAGARDPIPQGPAPRSAGGLVPLSANPGAANAGGYLIVTTAEYVAALEPLVAWKTACGYDVHVATTEEAGTTPAQIREYVRTAYETWDTPPLFLLLVGDVDDVPCFNALDNVSDHLYTCVDGDDFVADLSVGRFSAKSPADVAVQVAKTVGYESRPDTTLASPPQSDSWFTRALLVAGNAGSSTPIPTSRWVRDVLYEVGYTQCDTVFYPPWWQGEVAIRYYIDRGVSLVNYRGWAQGDTAWQPPEFGTTGVRRLRNGWKLPVVFSVVCHTGNFGNYSIDCFGETWLKAGTAQEPRGAVAFIGTGEHHSHSRWNDRVDIGLFEELRYAGIRQVGPLLVATKTSLLAEFPAELYIATHGEEAVEYYNYIYNLLGDPGLSLWTARPQVVHLGGLPRSLAGGQNFLTLRVTEADGTTPLPGAAVAFSQSGRVVGYATADVSGQASVSLAVEGDDPVWCTVTGENLYPLQIELPVQELDAYLSCESAAVAGGGAALPGVALDLQIRATNTGSQSLAGASATIAGPAGVEILDGETSFGALPAGATGTALDPVRVRIAAGTEDGVCLRFVLAPSVTGHGALPETEFWLTAAAPAFTCTAQTDGGDDVFDPGEEIELVLTLRNDGREVAGALSATLRAAVPGQVAIIDSTAQIAAIAPGEEGTNAGDPFTVRIGAETAIGAVVPLRLSLVSAGGPRATTTLSLVVGQAASDAPIGPDGGGYYCYDSADIDYPGQVPVYRWVECSPRFGGAGTRVPITIDNHDPEIVALPFAFRYYGRDYQSIRVSDNGWIAFDTAYWYDIRNWSLPNLWGAGAFVAAFWDNLNPTLADTDGIYTWYDEDAHRFVIEWSRLRNYEDIADDLQTFQIFLYDPDYRPTASGDGEIVFQYKQIINDDWLRMYSTVGIEDHTEAVGIQYCYSNLYAAGAAPLSPGLAIKFTTEPPRYDPLRIDSFTATWADASPAEPDSPAGDPRAGIPGCVALSWELGEERPLAGFVVQRCTGASATHAGAAGAAATASVAQPLHAGRLGPAARTFIDVTADPAAVYTYRLVAVGPTGVERVAAETTYGGFASGGPLLELLGPNPAGGPRTVLFRSGDAGPIELALFDATGRRLRTLYAQAAGGPQAGTIVWDGRDEGGRALPSGPYWLRLATSHERRSARVLVVR